MNVDTIDYSREVFDAAEHDFLTGDLYTAIGAVKDLNALMDVAKLEANHEYAYRLAGRVEPIENPAF